MKTGLIYGTLAAALTAMVASTIVREPYRTPGEGRRERHERYSKVGNAGDESAEAREQ